MAEIKYELESSGRHYLLFSNDEADGLRVELSHDSNKRHSLLHQAFRKQLRLRVGDADRFFSPESPYIILPKKTASLEILLGSAEPFKLASFNLIPETIQTGDAYVLSPFESRYLAHNGIPHPIESISESKIESPLTDLHTHYGGCGRASDLLRIGLETGVEYPSRLLEEAGIRIGKRESVPLADLPNELLRLLEDRLTFPIDHQFTFRDMEKVYRLRSPITKTPDAFIPLCRQIAFDYAAMGVKYIELSISNIIEAERLRSVHKHLPKIEEESGVRIRFLAALSRHDDFEWDLDYIDQMKLMSGSRYIAGIDFMGHETNSTRAFIRQIREIAQWAHQARPGFVIRVHAGENPAYPENIRIAAEAVKGFKVQLRIGHGLYGADKSTLREIKKTGTIVEFNLNSNIALNNIQSSRQVPIKKYVENRIPIALGTDGYGIYQTTLEMEARAALIAGLTKSDLNSIRETELQYLAKIDSQETMCRSIADASEVPDDPPHKHYTPAVMDRVRNAKRLRDIKLTERLAALNIPLLDAGGLNNLLRGNKCISFAGAWSKSWKKISPPQQERVKTEIRRLFDKLEPNEAIVITGGTHFGVENIVQQCARSRGFNVLGALVKESPPSAIESSAITHACIVGETLHDKAAGLYRLIKDYNGLCVFIGGGNVVNDEIMTAGNLRVRYLLMKGPEGASSAHALEQPERSFTCAEEVIRTLYELKPWTSTDEPYWHLGANPIVDIIITRRNPENGRIEVLLIRRDPAAITEPGKWALPGGFQLTDAPRGALWSPGRETEREACVRELKEETNLDIDSLESELISIGDYEGEGRDPRDTPQAWSRSAAFAIHLPESLADCMIAGADDASEACWFALSERPADLAFDHERIISDALLKLKERW